MSKIIKGNKAIPFSAKDLHENTINMENFKRQKVYLSFFRKAACPFCNMAIQQLIRHNAKLQEKGINILAFFASSKEEVLQYAGKQNAPFPIIADPDYKIYKKYGVAVSYKGMFKTMLNPKKVFKALTGGHFSLKTTFQDPVIPADFMINEDQEVHKAYYGVDYDDHLEIKELLKWN